MSATAVRRVRYASAPHIQWDEQGCRCLRCGGTITVTKTAPAQYRSAERTAFRDRHRYCEARR